MKRRCVVCGIEFGRSRKNGWNRKTCSLACKKVRERPGHLLAQRQFRERNHERLKEEGRIRARANYAREPQKYIERARLYWRNLSPEQRERLTELNRLRRAKPEVRERYQKQAALERAIIRSLKKLNLIESGDYDAN